MEHIYSQIIDLCKLHYGKKVVLFGSRARGDNLERSDIDIAVYGMPSENQIGFWQDIEELSTLLAFDIVHIDNNTSKKLIENIERDGVLLYGES